jgi:putative PIN family toxin of toxin-antitoxin system
MTRAVLDANVVISAMLVRGSLPWQVASLAQTGYTLVWSSDIVAECIRVAGYPKLRSRFQMSDPMGFLAWLVDTAEVVAGELPQVNAVRADPSDDVYLATALAGAAPFLVTGDRKHLLALKEFAGVRIVTPGEFLTAIGRR